MAKRVQLRRGTAAQHNTFKGAVGEVTVDTTNNTLRVHDGITTGGFPTASSSSLLGLSQAYSDVTTSRVKNTLYTNTTGRPLHLCVQYMTTAAITSITITVSVGGTSMVFHGGGDAAANATKAVSAYLVVPVGASYGVYSDFTTWIELR